MTSENFRALYQNNPAAWDEVAKANLQHMERLIALLPHEFVGLEIGCFKGGTTRWLMEHGAKFMYVIDTFKGSPEHQGVYDCSNLRQEFENNLQPYPSSVYVYECESCRGLVEMLETNQRFDFIYVDASHDSADVVVDAELSWKLLNRGGAMCFDDYGWMYHDDPHRNPKPAIDFFLACHARELELIERGYQVSVRKL